MFIVRKCFKNPVMIRKHLKTAKFIHLNFKFTLKNTEKGRFLLNNTEEVVRMTFSVIIFDWYERKGEEDLAVGGLSPARALCYRLHFLFVCLFVCFLPHACNGATLPQMVDFSFSYVHSFFIVGATLNHWLNTEVKTKTEKHT